MSDNTQKAMLKAMEGSKHEVHATYNPKQISVSHQLQWQQQKSKGKGPSDGLEVEFTQGAGRVLSVEIMIDKLEANASIKPDLDGIDSLLQIDSQLGRPPLCMFSWGANQWLVGVLTQANVTISMFDQSGNPLRATVSLSLQEAKAAKAGSSQDQQA